MGDAADHSEVEVEEAVRQLAADLAKLYGVTIDEAMRRLDRVVNP